MASVEQLINAGAQLIGREENLGAMSFASPQHPACVLYLGEASARFAPSLEVGLLRGWGNRAKNVAAFNVPTPAWLDDPSNVAALQTSVEGMMNSPDFANKKYCEVFCILDADGMPAEDFRNWYLVEEKIHRVLVNPLPRTMLIVLLNTKVGSTDEKPLKAELFNLYQDPSVGRANAHLYDGVLVLGNAQADGGRNNLYKQHDPQDHGTWDLIADSIVLANSDHRPCANAFFSSERVATTAAFKQVSKPSRDIVAVSLRNITLRLNEYRLAAKDAPLNNDTINQVLGYSNGSSVFLGEANGYVDQVLGQFKGFERGLPSTQAQANLAGLAYGVANDLSCGCLDAFVEQNHVQAFGDLFFKAGFEGLAGKIEQGITSTLNSAQLVSLSLDEWHEQVRNRYGNVAQVEEEISHGASLEEALRGRLLAITQHALAQHDVQALPVEQAIRHSLGSIAKEAIAQTLISTLDQVYAQAEQTNAAFEQVLNDVVLESSGAQNGLHQKIDSFYGDVVSGWLGGGSELQSLADEVFAAGNDENKVLSALYKQGLVPLFQSSYGNLQVFKLGFMEELVVRMGEGVNEGVAQTIVGQVLVEGMADLIAYRSLVPFQSQLVEAYLINSHAGPAARQLKDYLDQQPLPAGTQRVFMDGVSADSVTSIWIYPLTEEQLQY